MSVRLQSNRIYASFFPENYYLKHSQAGKLFEVFEKQELWGKFLCFCLRRGNYSRENDAYTVAVVGRGVVQVEHNLRLSELVPTGHDSKS
jgi:hypothetical protein